MFDAFDAYLPGRHPGGDNYLIKALACQQCYLGASVEMQVNTRLFDALAKISNGLVKFFLTGNALGHIELPADLAAGLVEVYLVAALGSDGRKAQPRRAGAHHPDLFFHFGGNIL